MKPKMSGGWIGFTLALAAAAPAQAQFPSKPMRLIVPFGAGSANDIVARIVAPPLSEALGRPIVIENRAGAAGNIGAELAAAAPADGHTLMVANIAHSVSVTLYPKLGYDLVKDFAPVTQIASGSFLLAVHPSVPVKSQKALVALARSRPGQINFATSGAGIILAAELFQNLTKTRMTTVQYKSTPEAITGLLSGEVSVGLPSTSAAMPHVRAGKMRGLGVTSSRRSHIAPEIPTVAEAGVPGYEASPWYGLMVPAASPKEAIARLHAETVKVLARPEVKQRFGTTDLELIGSTPEQFAAHVKSEIEKWGKIVKATGMRP
jgi:tripartite-type tricarboxylate transporter receptor subunit TctC